MFHSTVNAVSIFSLCYRSSFNSPRPLVRVDLIFEFYNAGWLENDHSSTEVYMRTAHDFLLTKTSAKSSTTSHAEISDVKRLWWQYKQCPIPDSHVSIPGLMQPLNSKCTHELLFLCQRTANNYKTEEGDDKVLKQIGLRLRPKRSGFKAQAY